MALVTRDDVLTAQGADDVVAAEGVDDVASDVPRITSGPLVGVLASGQVHGHGLALTDLREAVGGGRGPITPADRAGQASVAGS